MAVIDYTPVQTEIGRPLTEAEQAQVALWIADAEILIAARLGDLSALDQDVLALVVRKAVVALLRNPSGISKESRQIDDFKVSREFSTDVSITDAWWELLNPSGTSSAFTIRPQGEPDTCYPRTRWSAPGWSMP